MKISLPRLNGLKPTLESTALKLMEEAGELARLIGRFRRLSGETGADYPNLMERITEELLDVAQVAVTMAHVLQDDGCDLDIALDGHLAKLRRRGYLIDVETEAAVEQIV